MQAFGLLQLRTLSPSMHFFKSSSCCGTRGSPSSVSAMYKMFGLQGRSGCVGQEGFVRQRFKGPTDIFALATGPAWRCLIRDDPPERPWSLMHAGTQQQRSRQRSALARSLQREGCLLDGRVVVGTLQITSSLLTLPPMPLPRGSIHRHLSAIAREVAASRALARVPTS